MKYFSYHPDDGFVLHQTAEDAKNSAADWLDYERGEAVDEWSDYVDQICWGEVKQCVVETMCRPRTDDDINVSSHCDMIVDYDLTDVA